MIYYTQFICFSGVTTTMLGGGTLVEWLAEALQWSTIIPALILNIVTNILLKILGLPYKYFRKLLRCPAPDVTIRPMGIEPHRHMWWVNDFILCAFALVPTVLLFNCAISRRNDGNYIWAILAILGAILSLPSITYLIAPSEPSEDDAFNGHLPFKNISMILVLAVLAVVWFVLSIVMRWPNTVENILASIVGIVSIVLAWFEPSSENDMD